MQHFLGIREQMMDHVVLHQQACDILCVLNEQMMDHVVLHQQACDILGVLNAPFTEPCGTPNFNFKTADSLPPAQTI